MPPRIYKAAVAGCWKRSLKVVRSSALLQAFSILSVLLPVLLVQLQQSSATDSFGAASLSE